MPIEMLLIWWVRVSEYSAFGRLEDAVFSDMLKRNGTIGQNRGFRCGSAIKKLRAQHYVRVTEMPDGKLKLDFNINKKD